MCLKCNIPRRFSRRAAPLQTRSRQGSASWRYGRHGAPRDSAAAPWTRKRAEDSVPASLDEIARDALLAQGSTRLEPVQSLHEDVALAVLPHENRRLLPGFHDTFRDHLHLLGI